METGLYPQVFMLRRKDFKIMEANKKQNEAKLKFQSHSARPQSWLNIDIGWIWENIITREPGLYRKIYQRHDKTQDENTFKNFEVPIENSKCVKM